MSAGPFEYRGAAAGLAAPLIRKVGLSFYQKGQARPVAISLAFRWRNRSFPTAFGLADMGVGGGFSLQW